ncbi:response regulator [Patescibacteria group bacterium]|jgi:CheY-like chemotaxis protein|nr:response regulator [Patescibacteria group bacterium]
MAKQRVLLVEDDGFLASIYAQKLEVEGYDVSFATNGEDGLKLAQKDHPDLILMDILMPKMDGFEMLERLKADDTTKAIPVLVLSNLGQKEDVERCIKLGAAGYVIKAHSLPHETVKRIKEILHAVV